MSITEFVKRCQSYLWLLLVIVFDPRVFDYDHDHEHEHELERVRRPFLGRAKLPLSRSLFPLLSSAGASPSLNCSIATRKTDTL